MSFQTRVRALFTTAFSPRWATWSYSALSVLLVAAIFGTSILFSGLSSPSSLAETGGVNNVSAGEHAGDENYTPPTIEGSSDPHATADPAKEAVALTVLSASDAQSLADKFGFIILSTTGNTSVVAVPQAQVAAAKQALPSATFETNQRYTVAADQSPVPSWGLDRIDTATFALDNRYSYDSTGSGVRMYIVDTGINTSHVDFAGRIVSGYSPLADGYGYTDCQGHGTHVAGTAAGTSFGVAKGARITPVRVLNCAGSGYVSDIVSGINWILATHTGGPAVINLSIGGGYSSTLNNAIASASSRGFTVVVAAGNNAANACNYSPASAPSAITVGAVGQADGWASFSNGGSCVDISAPGVNIISDYIGSSTATAGMSGTSMASPHVAGAAARLLQLSPGLSPTAVAAALASAASKNLITGIFSGTTNNLLTLVAATGTPTTTATATPTTTASPSATTTSPSPTSTTTSPAPSPTSTTKRSLKAIKSLSVSGTTSTGTTVSWATDATETYGAFTLNVFSYGNGKLIFTQKLPGDTRSAAVTGLSANSFYQITLTGTSAVGTNTLTTTPLYSSFRTPRV